MPFCLPWFCASAVTSQYLHAGLQELSRHGRRRRLTSAMTDLLQGNSQAQQSLDDPPYGERRAPACNPQRSRAPSRRAHAKRASELLAAQLSTEIATLPEDLISAAGDPCGPCGPHATPTFLTPAVQDDWRSARYACTKLSSSKPPRATVKKCELNLHCCHVAAFTCLLLTAKSQCGHGVSVATRDASASTSANKATLALCATLCGDTAELLCCLTN